MFGSSRYTCLRRDIRLLVWEDIDKGNFVKYWKYLCIENFEGWSYINVSIEVMCWHRCTGHRDRGGSAPP